MFAKLTLQTIIPAPYYMKRGDKEIFGYNFDSNAEMLIEDGYKPVEETVQPADMKKPKKIYIEKENKIIGKWIEQYVEPSVTEQNEIISNNREQIYEVTTDQLTLRKLRKQALDEWSQEDETEYKSAIKEISEKIARENPYMTEG